MPNTRIGLLKVGIDLVFGKKLDILLQRVQIGKR